MNKLTIAGAAVALALSLPVAASAAGIGVSVGVNVGANASAQGGGAASAGGSANTNMASNAAANGSVAGSTDFNAVLDALKVDPAALTAVANLQDNSAVNVVGISTVANVNADALAKAEAANTGSAAELQAAIATNDAFNAQLQSAKVDVGAIVGAQLNANGALTLFTNG